MDNQKEIFLGEHAVLSTGQSYILNIEKPRSVEVLSGTNNKENKETMLLVDGDDKIKRAVYKEENKEFTGLISLPKDKKCTIQIPHKAKTLVFNLFPQGLDPEKIFQIPIGPFIDTKKNDPVKIFMYQPEKDNTQTKPFNIPHYSNNTFNKPPENESLFFVQEIKKHLDILEGPVDINKLDDELCAELVEQILGSDFGRQKISEKQKGNEFWNLKRFITLGALAGEGFWNHKEILKDFGYKGKFYYKKIGERYHIVFNGSKNLRKWYKRKIYPMTNPKVVDLSFSHSRLKSGLKSNNVTFFIVSTIDILAWLFDYSNDKHLEDLCATIGMDFVKVIIGNIITAGIAAIILSICGASIPICAVIGGTIVLGLIVGTGLDLLDDKLGFTNYVSEKGQEGKLMLQDIWEENVIRPLYKIFNQLEQNIKNLYIGY